MNFSRQAMLGTGVFLGGSILLYSVLHQVNHTNTAATMPNTATETVGVPIKDSNKPLTAPLTADIATEQRILAEKQKEREQRVSQQEQAAQQYLTEQQRVEAAALARSRAENQLYANKNAPQSSTAVTTTSVATPLTITTPVVKPRPLDITQSSNQVLTQTDKPTLEEKFSAPKPQLTGKTAASGHDDADAAEPVKPQPARPTSYRIQQGEGLIALSHKYDVPVSILAKVNHVSRNTPLPVGRKLIIPSPAQTARLQREADEAQKNAQHLAAQKAEKTARLAAQKQAKITQQKILQTQKIQAQNDKKAAYQAAQQKLREARHTVKEVDAKGTFGVQVALAADDEKAGEIAKKLRSAGYSVKTSKTTRGTRVVVGPEKGKIAALALKDKVNHDPRVNSGNAWVLYW